jgi:hypothetical protein
MFYAWGFVDDAYFSGTKTVRYSTFNRPVLKTKQATSCEIRRLELPTTAHRCRMEGRVANSRGLGDLPGCDVMWPREHRLELSDRSCHQYSCDTAMTDRYSEWLCCHTVICQFVLYGCGTRYLTVREELESMFGNRILKIMFGPQRGEVTINWRQLHNEKFHELYF